METCIDNITPLDALRYPELEPYVGYTICCELNADNDIVEAILAKNEDINWLYDNGIEEWYEFIREFSERAKSSKIKKLYVFELTDKIKDCYSIDV